MSAGRIKIKLAKLLNEAGFIVSPEHLYDQKGAWRTNSSLDVIRWECYPIKDGQKCRLFSWHPMSRCIKGMNILPEDNFAYEAWLK